MFSLHQETLQTTLTMTLVVLPIISALICLYFSFRFLIMSWTLKDNVVTKIRSSAQGFVELLGHAKPLYDITTKLSLKPAVWYQYHTEIWRPSMEEGKEGYWELIEQGKSTTPFLMHDATGECIILPENANVFPLHAEQWYGDKRMENTSHSWFLRILSRPTKERYRYSESRIEAGDPIYATGFFSTIPSNDTLVLGSSLLKNYCQQNNKNTLNLLSVTNLPAHHEFLITSYPKNTLLRKYRLNALMFFLAFLFFCSISVNSVYKIASKAIMLTYANAYRCHLDKVNYLN